MASRSIPLARWQSLYWLALGAFAIGTEGFMIAGLLPDISKDVGVSIEAAGQLVTIFALSYALSSPILTTLTARLDRRILLIAAMGCFCAGNIVAATAQGYWNLVGARVLLAFAAGVFIPTANALASALFASEFRGRALAVVNGGTTIAIALGVPLGALVGDRFGWRITFYGVAAMSFAAAAGLLFGLPSGIGANTACVTIRQRMQVLRQRTIFGALIMTTLWSTGSYTVYTYLATEVRQVLLGSNTAVSVALFIWGACAAVGVWIGGRLNDAIGSRAVILPALFISAISLYALSGVTYLFPGSAALVPGLLTIAIWGAAAWAVHPSQMARLIGLAGAASAPVVLSLNASFLYFGFAAGAGLGSLVMSCGTPSDLGWVGGTCQVLAVWVALSTRPPEGAHALGSANA